MNFRKLLDTASSTIDVLTHHISEDIDDDELYYYFDRTKIKGHAIMHGLFYQCMNHRDDSVTTLNDADSYETRNYMWISLNESNENVLTFFPEYSKINCRYDFRTDSSVKILQLEKEVSEPFYVPVLETEDDIFNASVQNINIDLSLNEISLINEFVKKYKHFTEKYGMSLEIVVI